MDFGTNTNPWMEIAESKNRAQANVDIMISDLSNNPDIKFGEFVSLFCDPKNVGEFMQYEKEFLLAYLAQKNVLDEVIIKVDGVDMFQKIVAALRHQVRVEFSKDRFVSLEHIRTQMLETISAFEKNNVMDSVLPIVYEEVKNDVSYNLLKLMGLKKL